MDIFWKRAATFIGKERRETKKRKHKPKKEIKEEIEKKKGPAPFPHFRLFIYDT
jgi:hypothetical protein